MNLLQVLVQAQLSEVIGWTLIQFLWEGAIIAAVLAVLLSLVRSPRIRYMAGCSALLLMLACFIATFCHFLGVHNGGTDAPGKVVLPSLNSWPDVGGSDAGFSNFGMLIPWLAPVWVGGVCLFYLRFAAAWLFSYKLRTRGVCDAPVAWESCMVRLAGEIKLSRPVVLMESLLADMPVVLGLFRPVIMTPLGFLAGMPPEHVEAILLHELAHISRWDYAANVCQRMIEGLLFYHPAVWWISRVIRAEREHCCDDMVVRLRGDAYGYAAALTTLEQNRLAQHPAGEPAMAATGGNLLKRINRLLYPKYAIGMGAPILATFVLMASTALTLAAFHLTPNVALISRQANQGAENPWQKWLNQDVVYIITDEERAAFERLNTDEERQHFVEQFWARRDPTPDTAQNEFKEEHYRRLAFANQHFASRQPGWKTDRGRIYIRYGPPDEIDSHPSESSYERPDSEGGGTAMTYPFEDWRYNHFEGVGTLTIEFVDVSSSGEFRMTLNPKEKYKKP